MSLYMCLSICACVSLWYAKYIWHVYQMSQKVQNVKMVSVCVCVYLYMCVCGMPNVKLVFLACMSNETSEKKFITFRILLIDA